MYSRRTAPAEQLLQRAYGASLLENDNKAVRGLKHEVHTRDVPSDRHD